MDLTTYNKFRTCTICGGTKELQYSMICPRCDTPEIVHFKHLNFDAACRHIDARYYGVTSNNPCPERQIILDKFKARQEKPKDGYTFLPITLAVLGGYEFDQPEIAYMLLLIEEFDLHTNSDLLWEVKW